MLRRDTRPCWCVDSPRAAGIPSHLIWIKFSNARNAVSRTGPSGSIRGVRIQKRHGRIQSSRPPPTPSRYGSARSIRPIQGRGSAATPVILRYPLCRLQYSIPATAVAVLVATAAVVAAAAAAAAAVIVVVPVLAAAAITVEAAVAAVAAAAAAAVVVAAAATAAAVLLPQATIKQIWVINLLL